MCPLAPVRTTISGLQPSAPACTLASNDYSLLLAALSVPPPRPALPAVTPPAQRYYTRALLPELYKVVGHASVFGDPVRLFHHLGLGVWSFLASPAAGGCVGLCTGSEGVHGPLAARGWVGEWVCSNSLRRAVQQTHCVIIVVKSRAYQPVTLTWPPLDTPPDTSAPPITPGPSGLRLPAGLVESARQRGPRQFLWGFASGTRGLFEVSEASGRQAGRAMGRWAGGWAGGQDPAAMLCLPTCRLCSYP